jgi:hypothetical protein
VPPHVTASTGAGEGAYRCEVASEWERQQEQLRRAGEYLDQWAGDRSEKRRIDPMFREIDDAYRAAVKEHLAWRSLAIAAVSGAGIIAVAFAAQSRDTEAWVAGLVAAGALIVWLLWALRSA